MEWSQKRKIIYAIVFAVIVILVSAYPVYRLVVKAPTCFDQKQNGTETGVDCGGGCVLQCVAEMKAPRVVWSKAFPLDGGTYDLGAYIENVNKNAGVKKARYAFRVFDQDGKLLADKRGSTEIAPGSASLLFATNIVLDGVPDRVDVVFNQDDLAQWIRASVAPSVVVTKNQSLKNADTNPRFEATLLNTDQVNDVSRLSLGAVIYDALRHPVAVSATYVDAISAGGEQGVFFTWPHRFTKNPQGGMCTTPVDTMLVFDRSGSMNVGRKTPPEPLTTAKNAASVYVDTADLGDKVGLVSFATTASVPVDHELSLDHASVHNTLAGVGVGKDGTQYTNLGDALLSATQELESARHDKDAKGVIIALTDGVSTRPLNPANAKDTAYADEYAVTQAVAARSRGLEIYTIGLGQNINESALRDRIATSPAHYFNALTAGDLPSIYKKISQTVCKPENFLTEIVITPRAIFAE